MSMTTRPRLVAVSGVQPETPHNRKDDEMWNITTNGHRRPLVYAYELTGPEREALGLVVAVDGQPEDMTAEYVRYRGDLLPVSDFMTTAETVWGGAAELRSAGWDGYLTDSHSSGLVLRYWKDGDETDFDFVVIGRLWSCDCSEDDGPCHLHSETVVSGAGASAYSADEVVRNFLTDAVALLADAGKTVPDSVSEILAELDRPEVWDGSWLADADRADWARHQADHAAADALADIGLSVDWDEGYRVYRLTGGPLVRL